MSINTETREEDLIFNNLIFDEDYSRKVIPYIKEEYFKEPSDKALFRSISTFIAKYNCLPTKEAVSISLANDKFLYEEHLNDAFVKLDGYAQKKQELDWLVNTTEEYCKNKALYNAAIKAVSIYDGSEKKLDVNAIPKIYEDALSISFDPHIGHDYFDDADARYAFMHDRPDKIAFDLDICNKVTRGGVQKKTLNILAAGVHVGKTLGLCHLAAGYLQAGKRVLFITLETPEEQITLRVDQNLLNISDEDLETIPKDVWDKKINKLRAQTIGKLKVKGYPPSTVHANNFRALLSELKLKQGFIPEIIIIDYLNICQSAMSFKSADNMYGKGKAVAEEIRALAFEYDIPIWTAVQLNREGAESSNPNMSDLAESHAIAATADLMWAIVANDKMKQLGQILIIQLKNRYKDLNAQERFYLGVDRSKMRWFEVEQKAQSTPEQRQEYEDTETEVKLRISEKHGSQAYKPAYGNSPQVRAFGPRNTIPKKSKFDDFVME